MIEGKYGPYTYKSVRKGDKVKSVYLGRGGVAGSPKETYTTAGKKEKVGQRKEFRDAIDGKDMNLNVKKWDDALAKLPQPTVGEMKAKEIHAFLQKNEVIRAHVWEQLYSRAYELHDNKLKRELRDYEEWEHTRLSPKVRIREEIYREWKNR